jgi:predicted Ser/Thr protein kinase
MPALDALPRKIGRYRLTEKIGEGGMGVVYLGTGPDGRQVAVKVLGPAVASDPNARRRLAREVDTMRRVRNRFVAEVVDADVAGGAPYIVTRFVPGQTLEEIVRANGPLRGAALDSLAEGLAEALAAIHAAGVVHRDLKPGNVMLSDGHPVVIDFGIAHVPDSTRLTKTGLVMGTPGYLAPEVIEGGTASGASDVHSWGATVAYAATGRQPFGTGNYQTIFFRVLEGKPEIDGVPARLLPLVTAALSTDPQARPSARRLAGQLGLPASARPPLAGPGATRADYPSTRVMPPSFTPQAPGQSRAAQLPGAQLGTRVPGPQAYAGQPYPGQPYEPYRSPAQAAQDVADLLPPVARPAATSRPEPAAPAADPRRADWQPSGLGLLVLAVGIAAVALSVLLPVAGTVISLAVLTLLRAADRAQTALHGRRSVRGAQPSDVVIVIATAPWAVVRAALTTVLVAPLAIIVALIAAGASVAFARTGTLPEAGSWAAGAAVAFYCVGPGSSAPRRQLRRMSASVIRSPAVLTVVFISVWALALAVVSSALSQPPLIWPATSSTIPHMLPGLPSLGSTLHSLQKWLLSNTVGMLHLP